MKIKPRRILVWGLIAVLLISVGGFLAYRGYKSARQTKLINQAKKYLASSNDRKALLCLQRALRYNSKDIRACRLISDLCERGRSPAAVYWRGQVVELSPRSVDDRLALAQTALVFREFGVATNALAGIPQSDRNTTAFHNISGAIAVAANQLHDAEAHFIEASRLSPSDPAPQLNLAVLRLHGSNDAALVEARVALQRFITSPTNSALRCQAFRELIVDSVRFRQTNTALALSKELLQDTNSVFADRLLRLNILRSIQSPDFKPALSEFQREAAGNPAKIYEMATWQMGVMGAPAEALDWLYSCPAELHTNQVLTRVAADCYSLMQNWTGLVSFVETQNWHELEFVRHALKTRGLRGQGLTGAAKAEWELTLKATSYQKTPLLMLLRMVAQWKWDSEAEETLWAIVNRYPEEKWAQEALGQVLYANGRTRPLMSLFNQQVKRSPTDLAAKNNLAMTALLLEAQEFKPHDLAREVYQQAPTNSSYISTYAFSLYLQNKYADALKVIQQLKPGELEKPTISGYYALILKATGDPVKAKSYFAYASKVPRLPEEQRLFERAQAGV
jgi:Flp pilus assembly protein TadD